MKAPEKSVDIDSHGTSFLPDHRKSEEFLYENEVAVKCNISTDVL